MPLTGAVAVRKQQSDVAAEQIVAVLRKAGAPMSPKDIVFALYREFKVAHPRGYTRGKLYRMVRAGLIAHVGCSQFRVPDDKSDLL